MVGRCPGVAHDVVPPWRLRLPLRQPGFAADPRVRPPCAVPGFAWPDDLRLDAQAVLRMVLCWWRKLSRQAATVSCGIRCSPLRFRRVPGARLRPRAIRRSLRLTSGCHSHVRFCAALGRRTALPDHAVATTRLAGSHATGPDG